VSDLCPTPTRLQLLRDVRAGAVFQDRAGISYVSGGPRVDNRITEMAVAGWVALTDVGADGFDYWQLTDAGRAVLALAAVTR
jgi:hypothetical protein